MKRFFLYLALCILGTQSYAQLTFLNRSTPEEEGIRSRDVLAFIDTVMRQKDTDIHGVMVLRNGKVIAEKYNEPFAAKYGHTLYSCSKTFTGVGLGLTIQDSLLSLNTRLVDILPEMLPDSVSESLSAVTVENLLTMQSGFPVDTNMRTFETEWIKAYLHKEMASVPGTRFAYDSIDSYLLSAIIQKVTGKTLFALLRDRIFTPMGITQVAWEESPEGISCGGWGLYMQLESMAKFGQLLLQRGEWNSEQLVSSEWVDSMMVHRASNSGGSKYGYHIWLMDSPKGARCDGAYGQYIYIIPEKQLVVAITQCMCGTGNLEHKAVANLALAALDKQEISTPLPTGSDYTTLQTARYRLTPTKGKAHSDRLLFPVKLRLGNNPLEWAEIEFDLRTTKRQNSPYLQINVTTRNGEKFPLTCDYQTWHLNEIKGYPLNIRSFKNNFSNIQPPFYTAASYGWTSDTDLYIRLHYVNWLTSCRLHFRFDGNNVKADILLGHTTKTLSFNAIMANK